MGGDQKILAKFPIPIPTSYCEHSHSTQASPTNTLKHAKRRQRARSADESNKILSPRDQIPTGEDWNIDASEILMGPRIGISFIFYYSFSIDFCLFTSFNKVLEVLVPSIKVNISFFIRYARL